MDLENIFFGVNVGEVGLVGRAKDAEDEYRTLVNISQNEHWRYWHAFTQYRNGNREEACQTVRKLGAYAMVNGGGAVLCDRQHDRELVLRNVMLVDNTPAGERMGEFHLRPLLFIGQRAKAEEMAKDRLGRLGNNLASWQKWDRARLSFYVDRKPDLLLQEAGKSPLLRCDAYSLIAADYLSRGDLDEARKYFDMAAETRVTWWPYYHIAVIFRERIDAGWKGVVDSSQ